MWPNPQFPDPQEPIKTRSFHFCHLNVNGILSKIDKLRRIKSHKKPAILGITESKLDIFFTNAEVKLIVAV